MRIERKELQWIRERAVYWKRRVFNDEWKRAYDDLAMAADVLDAFEARCTESVPDE